MQTVSHEIGDNWASDANHDNIETIWDINVLTPLKMLEEKGQTPKCDWWNKGIEQSYYESTQKAWFLKVIAKYKLLSFVSWSMFDKLYAIICSNSIEDYLA